MPRTLGARDLVKRKSKLKRAFKDFSFIAAGDLRTKRKTKNLIMRGFEEINLSQRLAKGKKVQVADTDPFAKLIQSQHPSRIFYTNGGRIIPGRYYYNTDPSTISKIYKAKEIKPSSYGDKGVYVSINPAHREYGTIGVELKKVNAQNPTIKTSNDREYRVITDNVSSNNINKVIIRDYRQNAKLLQRDYSKELSKLKRQSKRKKATILFSEYN